MRDTGTGRGLRYIEQLTVQDLRLAFKFYLDDTGTPTPRQAEEWRRFWRRVSKICAVVPRPE